MDQCILIRLAVIQGLVQCVQHKVRPHGTADTPAHNPAGKHINHKGHVLPALPGRNIREVRYPQLIGPIGLELSIDPVQWAWSRFVRDSGTDHLASAHAPQFQTLHEPLNGATGHRNAFTVHLMPDLVGTVNLHIGLPDLLDFGHQGVIRLGACTAQFRFVLARSMAPIHGRGNLQYLADRLDPVGVAMLVHKILQDLSLRSSSAWAKKALASFRISLARRSSLTSRSRALMRSRSSLVTPSRSPVSTSCLRTHSCRVWGTQPILAAMDSMAAHREGYSPRCSCTIRTARSRTSGEKRFDFLLMTPSSQRLEPPQFPGRFKHHVIETR